MIILKSAHEWTINIYNTLVWCIKTSKKNFVLRFKHSQRNKMIVTVNKAVENKSSHCRQNIITKGMLMFARSRALINVLDKRLENSNKSTQRTKHTEQRERNRGRNAGTLLHELRRAQWHRGCGLTDEIMTPGHCYKGLEMSGEGWLPLKSATLTLRHSQKTLCSRC